MEVTCFSYSLELYFPILKKFHIHLFTEDFDENKTQEDHEKPFFIWIDSLEKVFDLIAELKKVDSKYIFSIDGVDISEDDEGRKILTIFDAEP